MSERDRLDAFGVASLVGFAALLGFGQVVAKVSTDGFQPVLFAGLRSAGAVLCVGLWMAWRGISLVPQRRAVRAGIVTGLIFSLEFICLFLALDLTTVTRVSLIFYSMPVWMALGAHWLIPGQRISRMKGTGLAIAFLGVAVVILGRDGAGGGAASLAGDLFALGAALGWAGAGLMAKGSALRHEPPEMQLMWQVAISAPILLCAALFFGPLIRDLQPIHLWGLAFHTVVQVSAGFVFWYWLLARYPAGEVAAYGFLAPVFGVGLGWLILDEPVGWSALVALVLVAFGLWLMNRPACQVPQKV